MYRDGPRGDALASFRDDVPASELTVSQDGVLLVRAEPVPSGRVMVHTRCRWRGLADLDASHGVGRALRMLAGATMVVASACTMLVLTRPADPNAHTLWVMAMTALLAVGGVYLGLSLVGAGVRMLARIVLERHVEHPWAEGFLRRVADVAAWLVVDADGRRIARWRLHRRADTRTLAALRSTVEGLDERVAQGRHSAAT